MQNKKTITQMLEDIDLELLQNGKVSYDQPFSYGFEEGMSEEDLLEHEEIKEDQIRADMMDEYMSDAMELLN